MPELEFLQLLHKYSEKLLPHTICDLVEKYFLIYSDPDKLDQLPVFEATFGTLEKALQDSKYEAAEAHLEEIGFKA